MTVSEKIKKIIKNEGLKQYVVADKAGMDRKQFNALLNGKKTFMVDYLPQICKALNRTPDEIINYADDNQDEPKEPKAG